MRETAARTVRNQGVCSSHFQLPQFDCLPIAATCTHLYLAIDNHLLCVKRGVGVETILLKSPILDIVVPPDEYSTCALIRCKHEIVALWHESDGNRLELIGDVASDTGCGWTRGCDVVLACQNHAEVHKRKQWHFELVGKVARRAACPLAILPAEHPHQTLICYEDGTVELVTV